MNEETCTTTRADGMPCTACALPIKGHCFAHDPELAEQRRAGNAEGGSNRSNAARTQKLLPTQLRPVLTLLVEAMREVHEGEQGLAGLKGGVPR